jgi:hypothetical protein
MMQQEQRWFSMRMAKAGLQHMECKVNILISVVWFSTLNFMILTVFLGPLLMLASKPEEEEDIPSMDTLDIGRSDGIKSIPSYFSGGKDEEEEDIPDMDTYEDTGDNLVGKIKILYLKLG